ncbi:MAG: T9SS type A sorting domain-containing protein [Ignavibacteria bacterium]|nr:T9SS type A sorting domain-containing protein [Ignavibacteria bacterium]
MKKIILIFTITLLPLFHSYPQMINWVTQNSGTFENLNDIAFISGNQIIAAGNNGKIIYTTNGGMNWASKPFPVSSDILCLYFNGNTGFAGCRNSKIYKTVNGGNNWTEISSSSAYPVTSISFVSGTVGYAGNGYGHISKTTDAGVHWFDIYTMPGYSSKVFMLDASRGWAVDTYGYVVRTTNGGTNFLSARIVTDTLSSVHFISSTLGFIAGDAGRIYKSVNGGANWTLLTSNTTEKLRCVACINTNIIYATGNYGTILSTMNSGTNWSIQTKTSSHLNSIKFFSPTNGFIAGDNGTILGREPSPGNINVGTDTLRTGYPFYTFYMDSRTQMLYTASELIAGGGSSNGAIINKISFYVTSFASQTMNEFEIKLQNYTNNILTGFVFDNWTTVYQSNENIFQTGWKTFVLPYPYLWDGVNSLLIDICFNNTSYTSNSYVAATSSSGRTVHQHQDLTSGNGCTDLLTGSIQSNRPNISLTADIVTNKKNESANIPSEYALHQNYPNPFNPVTKIKFDLPKNGFTTLKIYNMLGQEISVLVNENKNAGSYLIDFNAGNLPSGTYFYKLISGNYGEIRKMVLIR